MDDDYSSRTERSSYQERDSYRRRSPGKLGLPAILISASRLHPMYPYVLKSTLSQRYALSLMSLLYTAREPLDVR